MRTHHVTPRPPSALARPESPLGTTLWIGDRQSMDFRDAYGYCEAASSQMAHRVDFDDARRRPASDVRRVVVARVDRSPLSPSHIESLAIQYPAADWLSLEGPHCAGVTRRQIDRPLQTICSATTCYLHQWRQYLPAWIESKPWSMGHEESSRTPHFRNLGVIADQFHNAETLMDLAAFAGATAVWFPTAHGHRMRNFDLLWWDDSAAPSATPHVWQQRLKRDPKAAIRPEAVHIWITNHSCPDAASDAIAGGIDWVLTKPLQIDSLLGTLCQENESRIATKQITRSPARLVA